MGAYFKGNMNQSVAETREVNVAGSYDISDILLVSSINTQDLLLKHMTKMITDKLNTILRHFIQIMLTVTLNPAYKK